VASGGALPSAGNPVRANTLTHLEPLPRLRQLFPCFDLFLVDNPLRTFYTRSLSTKGADRVTLLQGTLDLLILRILKQGPQHGHGIALTIQQQSGNSLLIDHGSLYPALQRLEEKHWIDAAWGTSDNNRRARFYKLTAKGRTQLTEETKQWRRLAAVIAGILGPAEA
jgi:PadR family transcriptional regulator PadR